MHGVYGVLNVQFEAVCSKGIHFFVQNNDSGPLIKKGHS